jgi:hypothetical protein
LFCTSRSRPYPGGVRGFVQPGNLTLIKGYATLANHQLSPIDATPRSIRPRSLFFLSSFTAATAYVSARCRSLPFFDRSALSPCHFNFPLFLFKIDYYKTPAIIHLIRIINPLYSDGSMHRCKDGSYIDPLYTS